MSHRAILAAAFVLLLTPFASGDSNYRYAPAPDKEIYFGHVSHIEAEEGSALPMVFRPGSSDPEQASLNFPIGPGDRLLTPKGVRLEIAFDAGTILRLAPETELVLETVLAPGVTTSKKMTNLVVERGRVYVDYRRYDRSELFQLVSNEAAIKLDHRTRAGIEVAAGTTKLGVDRGKAQVRYRSGSERNELTVKSKRELIADGQEARLGHIEASTRSSSFAEWNRRMNDRPRGKRWGAAALPRSVRDMPNLVVKFVEVDSYRHGEWIADELYGYVWRPYVNDAHVSGRWRPYTNGRWSGLMGERFWVPSEPWGWVPFHFGIWNWDHRYGWLWIPGADFSPGWVTWDYDGAYYAWRPWSLWDWYWYDGYNPYAHTCGYYLYYHWGSCACGWQVVTTHASAPSEVTEPAKAIPRPPVPPSPDTGSRRVEPPLRRPRGLEGVYRRVTRAFARGDANLRASIDATPEHLVVVPGNALYGQAPDRSDRATELSQAALPKEPASNQPTGSSRDWRPSPIAPQALAFQTGARALVIGPATMLRSWEEVGGRHRSPEAQLDWNPDVSRARELGVMIQYSRVRNRVESPGLALATASRRLDSWSALADAGGSSSYSPSGGGGSSSTNGSGAAAAAPPSNTANRSATSRGASAGKVKN